MALFSDVLLTADYDRTLTALDSSIPERNIEAIRYFMENGGAFTVNTGRSVPMTQVFRDRIPVSAPLLLYNGSAAYDVEKGVLEFRHEIQLDMWDTIRQVRAMLPGMTVEVQGIQAHYSFDENPAWAAFCAYNHCAYAFAREGDDLGPFLKFSVYGKMRGTTVDSMFHSSADELLQIKEAASAIQARFGDAIEIFQAAPRILDIHAKGVSKARAARELQQRLGRKLLVCVGDADNDLPMLYDADFAFCPADGGVADRFPNVCKCADGAVADVIYEKIPQILKKSLTD